VILQKKVSLLCVITNQIDRFCFEENVYNRIAEIESDQNEKVFNGISINGIPVEVLICDYGSNIKKYNNCTSIQKIESNNLNVLLSKAIGEYICILDTNSLLRDNWLSDLLFYSENIRSSGVVSISTELHGVEFTALLDKEDSLTSVFMPSNNCVSGTSLFKSDCVPFIGAVNTNFNPYEIANYSLRIFYALKRVNFYIPSQLAININPNFRTLSEDFCQEIVRDLVQRNDYYLSF